MTPGEKAQSLIDIYLPLSYYGVHKPQAKECAIICVEQIIPCTWKLSTYKKNGYISVDEQTTTEYWAEVLEILKNS